MAVFSRALKKKWVKLIEMKTVPQSFEDQGFAFNPAKTYIRRLWLCLVYLSRKCLRRGALLSLLYFLFCKQQSFNLFLFLIHFVLLGEIYERRLVKYHSFLFRSEIVDQVESFAELFNGHAAD